jgi:TetR/AcrR family transcriptional regulator, transcriptional repressor for nem operon
MPAVKQFDPNQVLERAMRVFWKRGYEATSIQDLVDATRINRASLYATFGGKRELFLAALARYEEVVIKALFETLADREPRRGMERMFEGLLRRMSDSSYPRGCLYTNTSLECPAGGNLTSRAIAEFFARQEAAIHQLVSRAQAQAVIDPNRDARALARFFLSVAHGLNVVNKATQDAASLSDTVTVAMSARDSAGPQQL